MTLSAEFWLTLGVQVLGLVGFALILLQGIWDFLWRREMERLERQIEGLETQPSSNPDAAANAGRAVLDEIKAQFARYRPVFGVAFMAGAILLMLAYLIRIGMTLTNPP